MWPVQVVVVEPGGQEGGTVVVAGEDPGVGPLGTQGAAEAFDLAVGPGAVRADELLPGTDRCCGGGEVPGDPVVLGVVGDDPLDGDAVAGVEGRGAGEEAGAGGALLIVEDLGVGQPGVIVHGGVDVVIAQPPGAAWAGAAAVGAPAAAVGDPAELLHIDVHQGPWPVVFVAVGTAPGGTDDPPSDRVTGGQSRGVVPGQDASDG